MCQFLRKFRSIIARIFNRRILHVAVPQSKNFWSWYTQFLSAIGFLYPEAEFSTEHGVKDEEYDNVIFVIGKGWNQYQFENYAPMIKIEFQQVKKHRLFETEICSMCAVLGRKNDCFSL